MDNVGDWLGDNAVDLIGLLATIGLLLVTFWYAKTTKDMANSARQAAQDSARATAAAERSAEASLDAARVAQSQIKPDFTGETLLLGSRDGGDPTPCLRIESTGDAVVIQQIRIRRAFRQSYETVSDSSRAMVRDIVMRPAGGDYVLPKRLHYGEHILVTHPVLEEQEGYDKFRRFIIDIDYTFTENGGAGASKELIFDV